MARALPRWMAMATEEWTALTKGRLKGRVRWSWQARLSRLMTLMTRLTRV